MATIKKTTSSPLPTIPPLITDPFEIDSMFKKLMNSFDIPPPRSERQEKEYRFLLAEKARASGQHLEYMKMMKEHMTKHVGMPSAIINPKPATSKDDVSFDHNGEKFIINRAEEMAMQEFMERKHREMFDKLISPLPPRVVKEEMWPKEKIQTRLDEIYAEEEKDMDPTWEFDLESGAFKPGDIVTDVEDNKFFVSEKGLLPMDDKAEDTIKQNPFGRGTLRLISAVATERMPDEGVAEKPSYSKLTTKMLEDAIGDMELPDFKLYTGPKGRKALNEAMRAAAAKYPLTIEDAFKKQQHLVKVGDDFIPLCYATTHTLIEERTRLTSKDYDYDMTHEDAKERITAIQDELNSRTGMDGSEVQMMSTIGMMMNNGKKHYAGGGLLSQINDHSTSKLLESMSVRNLQDDERRKFTMFNTPPQDLYRNVANQFDGVINPLPPSPGGGHGATSGFSMLKLKFNKLMGW